jgi:hypothetical protein
MQVVHLSAKSGPDGILHLSVPVGAVGEFEVAIVVAPKPSTNGAAPTPTTGAGAKTPEELGWPPGFFENVIGSIDDPAFKRYPQGDFEKRESFD